MIPERRWQIFSDYVICTFDTLVNVFHIDRGVYLIIINILYDLLDCKMLSMNTINEGIPN